MPERCSNSKWPLRPDCITSDYWILPDGSKDDRKDIFGLIPNIYMQGIQFSISDQAGYPSTIIEIVNSECRRTDSSLLPYKMCRSCEFFRKITLSDDGEDSILCKRCDDFYALLVHHLANNGWNDVEIDRYYKNIEETPSTKELYKNISYSNIKINKVGRRNYIEYDCPFLGFRVTIFPILLEDRLVATFFEEQIILDKKKQFIKNRPVELLHRFPNCFENYCAKYGLDEKYLLNTLHDELISELDDAISPNEENTPHILNERHERSRVLSNDDYENLIEMVDKSLCTLERDVLQRELESQRRFYVRTRVTSASRKIDDELSFITPGEYSEMSEYFQIIMSEIMEKIREEFSLQYVVMFASLEHLTLSKNLSPIAIAIPPDGSSVDERILKTLRISMDNPPIRTEYDVVLSNSPDSPLLSRLQCEDCELLGEFALISVPLHFGIITPPFFLFGMSDVCPLSAPEHKPQNGFIRDNDFYGTLRPLFTLIGSIMASFTAYHTAMIEQRELLYLSHELSQQCDGLDFIRLRYMETPDEMRGITDKKAEDLSRNIRAYLKQLRSITEFARKIAYNEALNVQLDTFSPYRELLGKWWDSFYMERERKKMILRYQVPKKFNDHLRPEITADINLLEMLIYNILNNAEKYGYRGTCIHMDFKLESNDGRNPKQNAMYILSITDYGIRADVNHNIFGAFNKSDNAESGLGIGLYLARKITEAHGGTITVEENEEISKYNIPLLEPCIRQKKVLKDKEKLDILTAELERLKKSKIYDQVVAKEYELDTNGRPKLNLMTNEPIKILRYPPSKQAIRDEIDKPTYKVTFVARFPRKENG